MKRISRIFCLFFGLLLGILPVSGKTEEFHWYCIRNKDHTQPPIPAEFRFIEEQNGYFIDKTKGDQAQDLVVYLTFDAGYENGNVAKILNTLREKEVPAAFFILSHLVSANGDLVTRMEKEGHLVCNHTAHHPNLSSASPERIKKELSELENAYRELTGKEMARYFRPPEGSFSRELLQTVSGLGYRTVFWSFAYADWDNNKQPDPEKAFRMITDHIHNGAVLLLHPTSATNAEILPRVIDSLKNAGYRFGTLHELCEGS